MIELDKTEQAEVKEVSGMIDGVQKFTAALSQKTQEQNEAEVVEKEEQKEDEKSKKRNTVIWQFRYRNYRELTNIDDPNAPLTVGLRQKQKYVVKARNYKVELDMDDPFCQKVHEALLKSNQRGVSFNLLSDIDENDTIPQRAETLRKLMEMNESQLIALLSPEEIEQAGLIGVPQKMELVMAIIDSKKLVS